MEEIGSSFERVEVECEHYAEPRPSAGRTVETVSYTCALKGGHVSPWRDCAECPENGAAECAR